jgi:four helix bundle protein
MAKLHIAEFSFQLVEALRPLLPKIKRCDRGLADQLQRAASSCALNLAEGQLSDPGNRRARFFTAAGSANESLAALRVAMAWGYIAPADAAAAMSLCRRLVAGLWKLTR